jgi:hypothetical protein
MRKISVILLSLFFITGCSSFSSEIKETINDTSVLNQKFIKGVTTKEDILRLFGDKPGLILDREALQCTNRKDLGYYEEWSYIVNDRTTSSKIINFFGGEIISKLTGIDIGKTKGYCIGFFFDEKGYLQDYKIYWEIK